MPLFPCSLFLPAVPFFYSSLFFFAFSPSSGLFPPRPSPVPLVPPPSAPRRSHPFLPARTATPACWSLPPRPSLPSYFRPPPSPSPWSSGLLPRSLLSTLPCAFSLTCFPPPCWGPCMPGPPCRPAPTFAAPPRPLRGAVFPAQVHSSPSGCCPLCLIFSVLRSFAFVPAVAVRLVCAMLSLLLPFRYHFYAVFHFSGSSASLCISFRLRVLCRFFSPPSYARAARVVFAFPLHGPLHLSSSGSRVLAFRLLHPAAAPHAVFPLLPAAGLL